MNRTEEQRTNILDNLIKRNLNFAIYRLPHTTEPTLVLQIAGDVEQLSSFSELNNRKGFVMIPFNTNGSHKILLIHPNIQINGWDEIIRLSLNDLPNNDLLVHQEVREKINQSEGNNKTNYQRTFSAFSNELESGRLDKLVLSRCISLSLSDSFSAAATFMKACLEYPEMMVYLCHSSIAGTWLGSTPEILINGTNNNWHTVALAGTRANTPQTNISPWSEKNKKEQQYVADYIYKAIYSMHPSSEIVKKGPYTSNAGKLQHLKTDFYFKFPCTLPIGQILSVLHPTPAICGTPKEDALDFILKHEGYDRNYYSGIIGIIDNNTELFVNLRCMNIIANKALLYAGGGIITTSFLEDEWAETEMKLATMKNIINDTMFIH